MRWNGGEHGVVVVYVKASFGTQCSMNLAGKTCKLRAIYRSIFEVTTLKVLKSFDELSDYIDNVFICVYMLYCLQNFL